MTTGVILAVLLAAGMHAGWNALVKIRGDRLVVMAVITLCGSIFSLMFIPFVTFPAPACWPFLLITIVMHTVYHFFLPVAYNHGDLGQVYPIARGSAPLLVTIGALLCAGERLTLFGTAGVLFLSSGVMALAFEQRGSVFKRPGAVTYALITGVLIASYTVIDGLGVRRAETSLGFAVWLTIGDGLLTFLIMCLWKGHEILDVARRNIKTGILGGAMQVSAYWIIIWALAIIPMATVSALRETSVLFAALISTFVLHEGFGVWRFVSTGLVALGLVATKTGR